MVLFSDSYTPISKGSPIDNVDVYLAYGKSLNALLFLEDLLKELRENGYIQYYEIQPTEAEIEAKMNEIKSKFPQLIESRKNCSKLRDMITIQNVLLILSVSGMITAWAVLCIKV